MVVTCFFKQFLPNVCFEKVFWYPLLFQMKRHAAVKNHAKRQVRGGEKFGGTCCRLSLIELQFMASTRDRPHAHSMNYSYRLQK